MKNDTYCKIVEDIILTGGDTDTALAIAYSIASVSPEIKNDLPKNLYKELENKEFGSDYLINLDKNFFDRFPKNKNDKKIKLR